MVFFFFFLLGLLTIICKRQLLLPDSIIPYFISLLPHLPVYLIQVFVKLPCPLQAFGLAASYCCLQQAKQSSSIPVLILKYIHQTYLAQVPEGQQEYEIITAAASTHKIQKNRKHSGIKHDQCSRYTVSQYFSKVWSEDLLYQNLLGNWWKIQIPCLHLYYKS